MSSHRCVGCHFYQRIFDGADGFCQRIGEELYFDPLRTFEPAMAELRSAIRRDELRPAEAAEAFRRALGIAQHALTDADAPWSTTAVLVPEGFGCNLWRPAGQPALEPS